MTDQAPVRQPVSMLAVFWFGILPLGGFFAELWTGMLSTVMPMFPQVGWAVAAGAAVLVNLLLWLGVARRAPLLLQVAMHAFVLGMALFYGLVEAPAIPMMVPMAVVGLGLLAAAPYWTLMGMLWLLPRLERSWRRAGNSTGSLFALLLTGALVPFGTVAMATLDDLDTRAHMCELDMVMNAAEVSDREQQLVDELRARDSSLQRLLGLRAEHDDDMPFPIFRSGSHVGDGRPFWWSWRLADPVPRDVARRAFYRTHGFEPAAWSSRWDDGGIFGGAARDLVWQRSEIDVQLDTQAAIAHVDWQLVVHGSRWNSAEARFGLQLPPGAVASGLSLWINGEERPAAFAGSARVQAAYDKVVAKKRDPALLQELAPGRLQLLLFPVAKRLPPMHVRLGFTVPLRCVGGLAELTLPHVASHNCRGAAVPLHELVVRDGDEVTRSRVDDAGLQQGIVAAFAPVAVCAPDADGWVTQQWEARSEVSPAQRFVVVIEASSSVAEAMPDPAAVLDGLPVGAACDVLMACGAGCVEVSGVIGDAGFVAGLRAVRAVGGCDARVALAHAFERAAALQVDCVYWLHGAMAMALRDTPIAEPPEGVELAALAIHDGDNLLLGNLRRRGAVRTVVAGSLAPTRLRAALEDDVRWRGIAVRDGLPTGDRLRRFSRSVAQPAGAAVVDDQLARLWSATTARALQRSDALEAAELAARYRLVTAGAGAVVLENAQQYSDAGLEPGAELGREPDAPIGSRPVPEPSTLLLVGSGLLLAVFVSRRRARARSPAI